MTLPDKVIRALEWNLSDVEELVCQFIAPGHVRLRRTGPLVDQLRQRAAEWIESAQDPDGRLRRRQAVADGLRIVTFNVKDENRVSVGSAVTALLTESRPEPDREVYAQVGDDWVDYMTHTVRVKRLADLANAMSNHEGDTE